MKQNCQHCGTDFEAADYLLKKGFGLYCSKKCFNEGRVGKHKKYGVGARNNPLYAIWSGMKSRCLNPKHQWYHRYGGRGITIHPDWLGDFGRFQDWALTNGYLKGLSIERQDNNKNYTPDNCTWIERRLQPKNREIVLKIEFEGEMLTCGDLAAKLDPALGITAQTIAGRIEKGWEMSEVISVPNLGNSRRGAIMLTFQGETHSVIEWGRRLNIGESTLRRRMLETSVVEEILRSTDPELNRYKNG